MIKGSFKNTLSNLELERLASVYSPMTARIAQDVGFNFGIVGGSIASMALLGSPDLSLLTSTELVEFVRKITQSTTLPIIVDGDGGYGNALNAMRLVRDLEHAGATAVTLEDTALPLQFKEQSVSLVKPQEHAAKLRSAVQARTSLSFGIIARTSVLESDDDESVLERIALYSTTGVDAICVTNVKDQSVLHSISSSTDLPLMIISYSEDELLPEEELIDNRVKIYLCGHQPFQDAIAASYLSYISMRRKNSSFDIPAAKEIIKNYSNDQYFNNLIKEYL
ncbi:oxaloacetate decarboxylase [Marinobacterium nitratireducens]|uniref:Oxaloacetate decarboxylase n=1 Tax=Marinobacterium nitratireducens TaxID=518897 RepID=A0A918DW02_9GAMM|nr:isocitrate lyase/PEP mutase family protein [Marinobacterium nitratireducens]GGO84166.1 oxaloacetate decarboxylase [Marinobacterium nitratireducens]